MKPDLVLNPLPHRIAATSLILLILLCLVWELWLAPLRPGGSYLVLKVLPLLLPLRGVLKGRVYTMQWACMLILLYFMEGVVRAWSDPNPASAWMAGLEILLSFTFYLCALWYLRPAKQAAKRRAREAAKAEADALRHGTASSAGAQANTASTHSASGVEPS